MEAIARLPVRGEAARLDLASWYSAAAAVAATAGAAARDYDSYNSVVLSLLRLSCGFLGIRIQRSAPVSFQNQWNGFAQFIR